MRHRVYGKHLSRDKNQRTALFKGLVRSLIIHESINTTEVKAKAIKGLVDRLISKGKEDTNAAKSFIHSVLPDKEVRKKLVEEVSPRYTDRVSGFTGMVRLGNRLGDGGMMVKMSLVEGGKEKVKSKKESKEQEEKVEEIVEEKETKPKTEKKVQVKKNK